MASKVSEWSTSESGNGDIGGTNIAEGCNPAGINDGMRKIMAQIATARTGSDDGLVTGTAGVAGNVGMFDANGDLIDGGIAPGAVADNAVTTAKLANDAVTRAKIADAAMSGADATLITGTAGTAGDLAQWNSDGDIVDGPSYGTGPDNLLQLNSSGALPAIDGSNLTGVNAAPTIVAAVATTSGQTINLATGLSGVRAFSVFFNSVGLSGASDSVLVQLGTSGGFLSSGYVSESAFGTAVASDTSGFIARLLGSSRDMIGEMRFTHMGSNLWRASHATNYGHGGGYVTLAGELTQIRLQVSGTPTDSFDNGSAQVAYQI